MKGKIAFVCGLAVGYVLGARAGRERYEQIKSATQKLWSTKPVQKYRAATRNFVGDRVSNAQQFVTTKTKQVLHTMTKPESDD